MTAMVNSLKPAGGDYSSIQTWIDNIGAESLDPAAQDLKVFPHGGITGQLQQNWVLVGAISGAVGHIVMFSDTHVALRVTTGTFQAGELCEVFGAPANTVTISTAGDPLTELVLECYKGDYIVSNYSQVTNIPDTIGWPDLQIVIRAAPGHEHGGVPDAGFKYRTIFGTPLWIHGGHVTVENIEISASDSNIRCIQLAQPVGVTLSRLLCVGSPLTVQTGFASEALTNLTIDRCLVWGAANWPAFKLIRGATVRNCGAFNSDAGFAATAFVAMENCVAYGNTTDLDAFYSWDAASRNNASGNGTPPGSAPQAGVVAGDFVDYGNDNFTPAQGGKLHTNGVDLSAHYTTDIAGTTYSQWDIGPIVNTVGASDLTFDGPNIANQQATGHVAYSLGAGGSRWSTSSGPIVYSESPAGTAWPAWLTIDPSSGIMSGTSVNSANVGVIAGIAVRATDQTGAFVDSNTFDIEVVAPPPPSFDPSLPADANVPEGGNAQFTTSLTTVAPPFAALWQVDEAPVDGTFVNMPGEAAANLLEFTAAQADDGNQYRYYYLDAYGQGAASRAATLSITSSAPVINPATPADVNIEAGATAIFSVTVDSGTGTYDYQWYESDVGALAGETLDTLTLHNVAFPDDDGRSFYCVVTDEFLNSATSRFGTLATNPAPVNDDPALPADTQVNAGSNAVLASDITNSGGGAINYQWEINDGGGWTPIAGETGPTLTIAAAASDHGNQYQLYYYDDLGQDGYTRAATLAVQIVGILERGEIVIDGEYDLFGFIFDEDPFAFAIVPAALEQGQEAAATALVQQHSLTADSAEHEQSIGPSAIVSENVIPDSAEQSQTAGVLTVWVESVSPQGAEQAQTAGPVGIYTDEAVQLLVEGLEHAQESGEPALSVHFTISIDGAEQVQVAATAGVTEAFAVEVYAAIQHQEAGIVAFGDVIGVKLEAEIIIYARFTGDVIIY